MTGHELVVLSLEPWDDVWRRNQYLVDGMLRRDPQTRVLFVEPPRDRLHDLLHGRRLGRGAGLRAAGGYDGRLQLLQPTKLLPRLAGAMADALLRREVTAAMRRIGLRHPILWVNDSHGAGLVRRTGLPSLYDITDDWLAAERPGRELRRLRHDEDVLLSRCGAVVVCSPALAASRGARRPVHLIPNAVDVARYRTPAERPVDLPERSAVYVGTLHEDRLDVELTARTARALASAGGSVVLVGPDALAASSREALREAGVRITGARESGRVPGYLQHADALIVPHIVDPFTESLDPLKLYEYQAVGRAIVSTAVAGFRDARGVSISTSAEFPDAVADAVRASQPARPVEGVPDWSDRVAAMAGVLDALSAGGAH
ncbi:glycosyltransferase [Microbacterium xylanilyticum]